MRRNAHVAALMPVKAGWGLAGGILPLWVFSTVLLQMEVPDAFRGRVFAAELALVTLTSSVSSYLTGHYLDGGVSPRTVSLALGAMFFVPGALWLLIRSRWKEGPIRPGDATPPEHSAPIA